MNEKPRVSILLPNYNNGLYLKECLESVKSQTYSNFKLIIVDDGSTDNSIDVINSFKDDRFILIQKEKKSGIVESLNIGLDKIDTEFMVRLDGDDYMRPDRLEKLIQFMDDNPEIGLCGSSIQMFGEMSDLIVYEKKPAINKANLIFCHSVGHASVIFRSNLFIEHGIRYESNYNLMEDYDLLYRLKDLAKMTSIEDKLYFYRILERNDPTALVQKKKETFFSFYKVVLRELGIENENGPKIHFELNKDVKLNFDFKDYDDHCTDLLNANASKKLYPALEFEKLIQQNHQRMLFRLTDENKMSFVQLLKRPKLFLYYLKRKLK